MKKMSTKTAKLFANVLIKTGKKSVHSTCHGLYHQPAVPAALLKK